MPTQRLWEKYLKLSGWLTACFFGISFILWSLSPPNKIDSSRIFILVPGTHSFYTQFVPGFDHPSDCKEPFYSNHKDVLSDSETKFCLMYKLNIPDLGYRDISSFHFREKVYFYSSEWIRETIQSLLYFFGFLTIISLTILKGLLRFSRAFQRRK